MSSYLAYSYSVNLTDEEKIKIDARVEESRKDFSKGFKRGMILSVSVYSVLLLVKPAHAADVPECPNPGAVAPVPKPGAGAPAPKGVAPFIERGTKPLTGDAKGIFVGGATAICASFFQSGDFMLGFSCAVLIVIGGIVINRTPDQ